MEKLHRLLQHYAYSGHHRGEDPVHAWRHQSIADKGKKIADSQPTHLDTQSRHALRPSVVRPSRGSERMA
jgi:hypothetical protein